ncbi:MAG: YbaB/EbfC family nucleoid-associated protein [Firmicutes bacterium]|nr:YbaB/EbfC family nucleoid-associated protein [Bacillota bacterium]
MGKGMKAGKKPRQRAGNMQQQMQQIQSMQLMMEKAQEEIEAKVVEASAGGGAVSVKVSGKKELLEVNLKPEVVDPDDIEMLQDLIIAAVNEGLRQISEISEAEMSKVTGGINIPGMM